MISYSIRLTLTENAYSFLSESMRCINREMEDYAMPWTFEIVHAVQAIELLLKERLRREHRMLVFTNIDKPRLTVGVEMALGRLRSCGVVLDPQDIERLRRAKEIRNDIVHYEVSATYTQLRAAYIDLFEFAHSFHLRELGEELHEHLDPSLWQIEAELMKEFRSQLVTYQGVQVMKASPVRIVSSQQLPYYKVDATFYDRITYTSTDNNLNSSPDESNCQSCGVLTGQFHIPGCKDEQCPACHSKATLCECKPEVQQDNYPGLFD